MQNKFDELLNAFAADERLPPSYIPTARGWFLPLAEELQSAIHRGELQVLGIVGSQGSGKSTLAGLLQSVFNQLHGLRTVSLSLDDFYLTRDERRRLAREVHPLLITRGVPGTHDIGLAIQTIDALLSHAGETTIPRFDKGRDERKPKAQWDRVVSPVDAVILEGWCVGAEAQSAAALAEPVNALEAREDPDGRWRGYVNDCLQESYPRLFALLDKLILLKAPDFDCVYTWRRQQEKKLSGSDADKIMSDEQLRRFIQHYERVTRHSLDTLPEKADTVFALDSRQGVVERYDNPHSNSSFRHD